MFDRWAEIAPRLRAAKHIALMLDFDGTIVPIRPRPEMVRLHLPARRLIARLARHSRVTVCMVSGRRLADLRNRVRLSGVRYIGLHGWEWERKKSAPVEDENLNEVKRLLQERLAGLAGVRLEDKKISFAVHYRGAPNSVARRASAVLRKTLKPFGSRLRMMTGKKIWEVLPPHVEGKGRAVRLMLDELPRGTLPIYIGDDTTDESAFRALRGGITIRVGRPTPTQARFCLRGPREVLRFLQALEGEIT